MPRWSCAVLRMNAGQRDTGFYEMHRFTGEDGFTSDVLLISTQCGFRVSTPPPPAGSLMETPVCPSQALSTEHASIEALRKALPLIYFIWCQSYYSYSGTYFR